MHKVVYLHIGNTEIDRAPIAVMIVVPDNINIFNLWNKFRSRDDGAASMAMLMRFVGELEKEHGVIQVSEVTTIGVKA